MSHLSLTHREAGTTVWSSKVVNDETAILEAISEIRSRADHVIWAADVTGTMSGLLLALLAAHDETVKYVPGRIVNKMADTYRGEAKTDARISISSQGAPGGAGRPFHRSHLRGDQGSATPGPPGPPKNLRIRAQAGAPAQDRAGEASAP